MSTTQTIAPTTTAVTLVEAKDHLRVDHPAEDSYIVDLVHTATATVEHFSRKALIQRTSRLDLPCFPRGYNEPIRPEWPPLVSATITYTDANGTTSSSLATTVYNVDTGEGLIWLAKDQAWPTTQDLTHNAVQVTYVHGMATSSTGIEAHYRHAMKMLIDRFYNERTDYVRGTIVQKLPYTVLDLIKPTRNYRFV